MSKAMSKRLNLDFFRNKMKCLSRTTSFPDYLGSYYSLFDSFSMVSRCEEFRFRRFSLCIKEWIKIHCEDWVLNSFLFCFLIFIFALYSFKPPLFNNCVSISANPKSNKISTFSTASSSLDDTDLSAIYEAFKGGIQMNMLKLSANRITGTGVNMLVDSICKNKNCPLSVLDLSNNRVGIVQTASII